MKQARLETWVRRAFLAPGVVLLIVGAVVLVRTVQFVAEAERATGTVIDLSREEDSEGDVAFYPVVRFTTADGVPIEFVSTSGSNPPSETPGDPVEVLYDPDDPSAARLSGLSQVWLTSIILLGMGSIWVGVFWLVRRISSSGPSEADFTALP